MILIPDQSLGFLCLKLRHSSKKSSAVGRKGDFMLVFLVNPGRRHKYMYSSLIHKQAINTALSFLTGKIFILLFFISLLLASYFDHVKLIIVHFTINSINFLFSLRHYISPTISSTHYYWHFTNNSYTYYYRWHGLAFTSHLPILEPDLPTHTVYSSSLPPSHPWHLLGLPRAFRGNKYF